MNEIENDICTACDLPVIWDERDPRWHQDDFCHRDFAVRNLDATVHAWRSISDEIEALADALEAEKAAHNETRRENDALTREVANLRDKRSNVALTEAVGYLSAELADHAKDFVHPAAAIRRNLMRGFVAEYGGKVGEE